MSIAGDSLITIQDNNTFVETTLTIKDAMKLLSPKAGAVNIRFSGVAPSDYTILSGNFNILSDVDFVLFTGIKLSYAVLNTIETDTHTIDCSDDQNFHTSVENPDEYHELQELDIDADMVTDAGLEQLASRVIGSESEVFDILTDNSQGIKYFSNGFLLHTHLDNV